MEFRTRCRIVPALFAFTFCAVPVFAQKEPDGLSAEDLRATPAAEQDPFAQPPGVPGGQQAQQQYRNAVGQGGGFNPMGQPGFGQSGIGFNPMMVQSPEMAKKMRAIMVLRQMWQLRLTAKDISAILPALRELAEAEKNLQVRSERILEEERRALLTADPDGDPPDGTGDLMQREHDLFRIKSDDTWRAIDRSIGRGKANGIRQFLGIGGQAPFNNPGDVPGAGFGRGQGGAPPNTGGFQLRQGGGGFGGGAGLGGDVFPAQGGFGGGGVNSPNADNPLQPTPGVDPARRPRQNRAPRGGADDFAGAPPPVAGQNFPTPGGSPAGRRAPAAQNSPNYPQGLPGRGGIIRVSLTELVSLLGEKLAAMRK